MQIKILMIFQYLTYSYNVWYFTLMYVTLRPWPRVQRSCAVSCSLLFSHAFANLHTPEHPIINTPIHVIHSLHVLQYCQNVFTLHNTFCWLTFSLLITNISCSDLSQTISMTSVFCMVFVLGSLQSVCKYRKYLIMHGHGMTQSNVVSLLLILCRVFISKYAKKIQIYFSYIKQYFMTNYIVLYRCIIAEILLFNNTKKHAKLIKLSAKFILQIK